MKAASRLSTVLFDIGVGPNRDMALYLVTIAFQDETIELSHTGSLKTALKTAWAVAADKKAEPINITFRKDGAPLSQSADDGWQTVMPIERVA
jgi:hypothetical protein